MNSTRRRLVVAAAVLVGTAVSVLYEIHDGRLPVALTTLIAFHLGAFGITSVFAVWIAEQLGLPSLLSLEAPAGRRWGRLTRLLLYGGLGGVLIGSANGGLYLRVASNPLQPPRYLADLTSLGDAALLAARSALLEETFFRLFAIPFFALIAMRIAYGWRPRFQLGRFSRPTPRSSSPDRAPDREPPSSGFRGRRGGGDEPTTVPRPIVWLAALLSAVLFGLAHPFNPLPALVFGVGLAWIYLRGGWESAVLAHFIGNFVLFYVFYL